MSLILAIESSCDEMSIAILKDKRELLCNVVASQIDTHRLFGGVVPEIASRMHVECVSTVLKTALQQANINMADIDAIAVTKGPGLVGSLHVGMQAAKTLALAYHKPLIGVHHIAGHIYANELVEDIKYPCLCLVVSGGHSELVYMKSEFHLRSLVKHWMMQLVKLMIKLDVFYICLILVDRLLIKWLLKESMLIIFLYH